MGFKLKKESYSGGIKAISIGKGDAAITVGGETCYPFYTFEGDMPNKPIHVHCPSRDRAGTAKRRAQQPYDAEHLRYRIRPIHAHLHTPPRVARFDEPLKNPGSLDCPGLVSVVLLAIIARSGRMPCWPRPCGGSGRESTSPYPRRVRLPRALRRASGASDAPSRCGPR